jgi:hypothetical protein
LLTTIGVRTTEIERALENERIPPPPPPDLAKASSQLKVMVTSVAAPIARVESILEYVVMTDLPDPTRAPSLFNDQRLTGGCGRRM